MRQTCKNCGFHTGKKFDIEKSQSFEEIVCDDIFCQKEKQKKCVEEGSDILCGYSLKYEEKSFVTF
jgi:hypothetical protein